MTPDPAKPADELSPLKLLGVTALQLAIFCGLGLLLWHLSGRDLAAFVTFSLTEVLMGVALAGALIALAAALFRGFPRIGEQLVRLQAPNFAFFGRRLGWPMIAVISVGAGVGEEALFRGGLQTLIGDNLGVVAAILLSSAAFAAIHLAKPLITALLLVIGTIFGVFYWQTGSLIAAMVGHALYDIWALRYLHREMHRLNLFDQPEPEPEPAPLANSLGPG